MEKMAEIYETTYDLRTKRSSDLEAVLFGESDCGPSHSYGPTIRPYHLFHFITRGRGTVEIGGVRCALSSGDAFLIPAEQTAYYEADTETPWSYAWAGLTGIRSDQFVRQIQAAAPERCVFRGLDTKKYAASIHKAVAWSRNGYLNYFQAGVVLYELLSYLTSDFLEIGRAPSLIEEIKFFIDAKYAERIQMRDIADHFHIHPNHLCRLFKETYHTAPKPYLQNLKTEKAALMLSTTDIPVSLIAESLGFADHRAFSRSFRKRWGISPAAYRNESRADTA